MSLRPYQLECLNRIRARYREGARRVLVSLRRFGDNEITVLTNCNVLTEGFDEPRVDCVIMARPTSSQLLYAQMVGRVRDFTSERAT